MKRLLILLTLLLSLAGYAQTPDSLQLKVFTGTELRQDYDLMINSLREAHTGLYWYNTKKSFNAFAKTQRKLLHSGMNGLEFYQVIAPVIAFTKEGHTSVRLSKPLQQYLQQQAAYLPAFIKILNHKIYLINDLPDYATKGSELISVNGVAAQALLQRFMRYEPSDGYNLTGKYRWIEENAKFNVYYARCFPTVKSFIITFKAPDGHIRKTTEVPGVSIAEMRQHYAAVLQSIPNSTYTLPATIKTDSGNRTAVLTINSFQKRRYAAANMEFHAFVREAFAQIKKQQIKKLIIDVRQNGGGTEGYEDYLLSFMIKKDYQKYSYVQASALHYSFYSFTDYRQDWPSLDSALKAEHYRAKDGRILRRPGVEAHEKPQPDPYKGKIVVLTSGLTYSGGSEFAALMRNHTNAIFIGEETGGGYYGNTSGYRITLQLPNTGLEVAIPILKFVVAGAKPNISPGHGVLPDIPLQPSIEQYLQGIDPEMEEALKIR